MARRTAAKRPPAPTTKPVRRSVRVANQSVSGFRGRSITAAAKVLNGPRVQRATRVKNSPELAWQQEGWEFYDTVGEYAFGIDLVAQAVAQVRLVAAMDTPNQDEPEIVVGEAPEGSSEKVSPADEIAADLVAQFAGGSIGQQQLMRRVATQVQIAAESYIVGRLVGVGEEAEEVWEAYSRGEIKWSAGGWQVDDGVDKFELTDDDVLIRVWIPSPRKRSEPRSFTKPALPVLREIHALTQSIAAQTDSRLAGAGMLVLPHSVELAGGAKAGDADPEADEFVEELMDMMITPIKDRDSAAAIVPIVVKVSDEAVGKIQYLRFDAPSDLNDADKRDKAIVRLARTMDLPQEQLTGVGDANHWTGWLLQENTIKGPVSNLAAIIVHACTLGWYQPALETAYEQEGIPVEEARDRMMWFDASVLEQRPDRSEQAQAVFDRGGLNLAALARENGFGEDDMPDPEELLRILLFKLITLQPELAVPLIDTSGLLEKIILQSKAARDPVADPSQTELPAVPDETADPNQDNRQLPTQPSDAGDAAPGAAA